MQTDEQKKRMLEALEAKEKAEGVVFDKAATEAIEEFMSITDGQVGAERGWAGSVGACLPMKGLRGGKATSSGREKRDESHQEARAVGTRHMHVMCSASHASSPLCSCTACAMHASSSCMARAMPHMPPPLSAAQMLIEREGESVSLKPSVSLSRIGTRAYRAKAIRDLAPSVRLELAQVEDEGRFAAASADSVKTA